MTRRFAAFLIEQPRIALSHW